MSTEEEQLREGKLRRYIELKAVEKEMKKEMDEINKYFKKNWVDDSVCNWQILTISTTKTAELIKDEDTLYSLSLQYPQYLEFWKKFLEYVKQTPELHEYITYKESVVLNIKKADANNNSAWATSSVRDELF